MHPGRNGSVADRVSRFTTERLPRACLRLADAADRPAIYRLRHEVYARELGQHPINAAGRLSDALDERNDYIVADYDGVLAGFVSLTPPGGRYSVDKYVERDELPFPADELWEVRLLTVAEPWRNTPLASLLMHAAFRYVESRGGERIVAIGRREVLPLYRKAGFEPLGRSIDSGAVRFELMTVTVDGARRAVERRKTLVDWLVRQVDWRLPFAVHAPAACFHGGAFWDALGPRFDGLERRGRIITADVLDAWFPPAPGVIAALREDLPFLLRTSPPTDCGGLLSAISAARGVPRECLVPGAGSSSLIFLAFLHWCQPSTRALLLDPTYGEYAHVLERVIGCRVDRLPLSRETGYRLDLDELVLRLRQHYDLVVLVNPNSPTGQHVPRCDLEAVLRTAPRSTRIWIDETYVEYAGRDQSLEAFAAAQDQVVVCKSMSKVYALSGARVAYLVGSRGLMAELRARTPPWAVSLPAQLAAVRSLEDPAYYADRYQETHRLRSDLSAVLHDRFPDWDVLPGIANFQLCHLPQRGPTAADVVRRCRQQGVFLRDAGSMSPHLGEHTLRIAVRNAEENRRIISTLELTAS
jgi:histidinol-phosphate/aromatic aminotransferase/cobyric acid decarboxylase-like protein/GNAT superfamily N-acetyltransferase